MSVNHRPSYLLRTTLSVTKKAGGGLPQPPPHATTSSTGEVNACGLCNSPTKVSTWLFIFMLTRNRRCSDAVVQKKLIDYISNFNCERSRILLYSQLRYSCFIVRDLQHLVHRPTGPYPVLLHLHGPGRKTPQ